MIGPCECGSVLQMKLLLDERPCRRITKHEAGCDGAAKARTAERQIAIRKDPLVLEGTKTSNFTRALAIVLL